MLICTARGRIFLAAYSGNQYFSPTRILLLKQLETPQPLPDRAQAFYSICFFLLVEQRDDV